MILLFTTEELKDLWGLIPNVNTFVIDSCSTLTNDSSLYNRRIEGFMGTNSEYQINWINGKYAKVYDKASQVIKKNQPTLPNV